MYNILICDDDKEIVKAIEIYLTKVGYNCIKSYNGEECLNLLKGNKIHLVILDIMMPVKDGIDTLQEIKELYTVPVIMLSAKSEDSDKIQGLNLGADDYVTKPFNHLELIARVNSQLRRYTKLGAEDTELTIQCVLNDINISYLKDAVFYDEQAIDFKTSIKQRKRWSYGTLQCLKKYYKPLILKNNTRALDMLMFMMASIVQLITVVVQILTNVLLIDANIFNLLFVIITSYIFTFGAGAMSVLMSKKKIKAYILLLFPIFILTWIPINILVLFKKECKWEQIRHDRGLTLEEIA